MNVNGNFLQSYDFFSKQPSIIRFFNKTSHEGFCVSCEVSVFRGISRSRCRRPRGRIGGAALVIDQMTRPQLEKLITETTRPMKEAAKQMDFMQAAQYRDEIIRMQKELELK